MDRLTFEGNFCDISQCTAFPCLYENDCSQKQVWERLKQYEDTGLTPEQCANAKAIIEMAFDNDTEKVEHIAELLRADKDGRVCILSKSENGTCGSCGHFHRIAGTRSGTCDIKPYCGDRWGHVYPNRAFTPQQSRKACKQYFRTEEAEQALEEGEKDG